MNIKLPADLTRELKLLAERRHISLDQYIIEKLCAIVHINKGPFREDA